ncbi:alkaline phosphatase [Mycolicibacterium confluentis]|uniref:Alkaline phosphatase n=1 Tax=Mycolicibacterium confluentis TaxID=28047 RepID=A0A7I7XY42_9MYCO|nr:alkaline phosphatase [Mycolicibacterium confluentis]MCV7317717.1 alkaline phosphatase [Mycolicibacterium confluentis]ORV28215.1 alkaline phosphatase [Mycolicibacterium confluentis]BBZ34236.1 alkaline phosphatase [Mycolicibacterium confluentis]
MQKYLKSAAVLGALAMLPLVACGGDNNAKSNGDTVTRQAAGDLTAPGGARRLDGDQSGAVRAAINDGTPRNVILLIGDGMGDSEITIARNYEKGAGGVLDGLDALPLTGQYTTYALRKDGKPNYVTDSAASATAWSTGTKTYNGALGIDIKDAPHATILELAKAQGFATGDVTTSEIQDATPASQFSHITERDCYGPEEMADACPAETLEKGGPGSVTEQMLATRPDLTLGGGFETFAQTATAGDYAGKTLEVQAKERGYQIVRTAGELDSVAQADQDKPVLGLFADGNLPVRWTGPAAVRQGYLQPAGRCADNPARGAGVPKLADMTAKAIDLLKDSKSGSEKGFFLQVEGASIDKRDHAADPCGQIGETVDFDAAVQQALEFARADGNTLVIVTADHGHSSQIVEEYTEDDLRDLAGDAQQPIEKVRDVMYPGLTRRLTTADDAEMIISYGTSADVEVEDESHTGTQVRVAAYGPRAANVLGLTDQTDLFFTMTDALGIDRDAQ